MASYAFAYSGPTEGPTEGPAEGPTERPTEGPTDGPTDGQGTADSLLGTARCVLVQPSPHVGIYHSIILQG